MTNSSVKTQANARGRRTPRRFPDVVHRQRDAVQAAPGDEGPVGAVPQPAEQHGRDHVRRLPRRAAAVAAQRNVEVVAQEAAERHVPAAPEVAHRQGAVGRVEVERDAQAEHQRQADRHVGIAGEVEVDLQRVGAGGGPGLPRRIAACRAPWRTADRRPSPACRRAPTFFATPIMNRMKPRDRFSHIPSRRGSRSNWWMISLCRTSGPAMSCGKNITNMQKSRKP